MLSSFFQGKIAVSPLPDRRNFFPEVLPVFIQAGLSVFLLMDYRIVKIIFIM